MTDPPPMMHDMEALDRARELSALSGSAYIESCLNQIEAHVESGYRPGMDVCDELEHMAQWIQQEVDPAGRLLDAVASILQDLGSERSDPLDNGADIS